MGPLPKRKLSKTRKRTRRNHDKLTLPNYVACDNCGAFKPSHQVCKACGMYKGVQVLDIEEKE